MTDHALMIAAADAMREAAGARARFPGNRLNHLATIEEVGEHAQALLEHSRGKVTAEEVYAEAIQCAAMYLRLATEGTAEVPYEFTPSLSAAFKPTTPKNPPAEPIPVGDVVAAPARPLPFPNPGWPDFRVAPRRDVAVPYHGMTPPPKPPRLSPELNAASAIIGGPLDYSARFDAPSAGNEI